MSNHLVRFSSYCPAPGAAARYLYGSQVEGAGWFADSLCYLCEEATGELDADGGIRRCYRYPRDGRCVSSAHGGDPYPHNLFVDSKRSSSPSLLARQLRLRLVASEGSDIPKNFNNIVVSIHAIATFQALHDYLRPRVSGLMFSGSRLSGMLAALAGVASGGLSSSSTKPPEQLEASTSAGPSTTVERRRSQRLSAKNAAAAGESATEPPVEEAGPSCGRG